MAAGKSPAPEAAPGQPASGLLVGLPAVMVILGTMAHTLITSVQRRRRDLAVLKTLGFVRGQVAATIAWQATTFAVVALCLGLPFGGRRRHGPGRQSGRRRPGQDGQSHAT